MIVYFPLNVFINMTEFEYSLFEYGNRLLNIFDKICLYKFQVPIYIIEKFNNSFIIYINKFKEWYSSNIDSLNYISNIL